MKKLCRMFVLFDLILYIPSTILQLCRDMSSWVELVLSIMCLAQGHNAVMPVRLELAAPRSRVKHSTPPLGLESSTLPLSHCPPLCRMYLLSQILCVNSSYLSAIVVCGQPLPTRCWTQIRPTKYPAWSWFKLLDTLMIFLKLLFENVNFKKKSAENKNHAKLPSMQTFNSLLPSGEFCRLLPIFANRLDPDQAQQNIGPDLDPNSLTL